MKKLILLLLIGFLLAACGQASSTEEPRAAEDEQPAIVAVPEPAETDSEGYNAETDTAVAPENEAAADNNDNSNTTEFNIATTVNQAAQLRETDWVKGAEDPLVTIIEYGDFQ